MKLFQQFFGNSMALRAVLFSTQAPTRQFSAIAPLERMIMGVRDPKASVVPILENWVQEGNKIEHSQLQKLTTDLLPIRSNHALQMLQWMGGKGGYEPSAEDIADQLELTSKVHRIEQVEMYFDAIPNNLRGYEVYCALLTSYADHDCLRKAEATMQKIRELGFLRDALPYNVMLEFYSNRGCPRSMNILAEEMREKGINYNRITYNILFCSRQPIDKMEELLTKLEADPLVNTDWYHYLLAAEGYWLVNKKQKTLTMLKKSEESMEMEGNLNRFAFELLTVYAAVGNKAHVYRLWSLYKLHKGFCNKAYLCMINSLIDLDDMDGAESIWEEWLSKKKEIDFGIPQAMISAYGGKCQWEKAEAIVFRMTESGIEPDADTIYHLAIVYLDSNEMDKAVEASTKAISVNKPGCKPSMSLELIDAYASKCQWEKAEAFVFRMMEGGIEPDADTLYGLAYAYEEGKQMDKAVEASMKALSVSEPGWEPDLYVIGRCFDYLDSRGDDVAKEELYKMLKERCCRAPAWACEELKNCENDSGQYVTCYMR